MHRLQTRTYIGEPDETVRLTTQLDGGGQIAISVDGQPLADPSRFSLPLEPGGRVTVEIALVGALGASCVVGIADVDGGRDGDLLLCQAHDPAPVHFYIFSVAPAAAVAALTDLRAVTTPPRAGARGRGRR